MNWFSIGNEAEQKLVGWQNLRAVIVPILLGLVIALQAYQIWLTNLTLRRVRGIEGLPMSFEMDMQTLKEDARTAAGSSQHAACKLDGRYDCP